MSKPGVPDYIDVIQDKLSDIIARLERIEQRQIAVKAEIESSEPMGGFGSVDPGQEQKQSRDPHI